MYEMVTRDICFVSGYPPGIKYVAEIGFLLSDGFIINVLAKRTVSLLRKIAMLISCG
jgi:hypothetical protein